MKEGWWRINNVWMRGGGGGGLRRIELKKGGFSKKFRGQMMLSFLCKGGREVTGIKFLRLS